MKPDNQEHSPANQPEVQSNFSGKRRNLVRNSLLGGPILLALKSSPVLAAVSCKQPSGFSVSGNLSQTHTTQCQSPANGPTYWVGQYNVNGSNFGTTSIAKNTKFKSVGLILPIGITDTNYKLIEGLNAGGDSAIMISAYLNASVAGGFPVDQDTVKAMWNSVSPTGNGYKVPNTTITWNYDQVMGYLKYVMALA